MIWTLTDSEPLLIVKPFIPFKRGMHAQDILLRLIIWENAIYVSLSAKCMNMHEWMAPYILSCVVVVFMWHNGKYTDLYKDI